MIDLSIHVNGIKAILFDLGNVLIDVDFFRCARIWSEYSGVPAHQLVSNFRMDDAYRSFERGQLNASGYFSSLRQQLGIDLTDDVMRKGWNAIIRDEKPGIRQCIQNLARDFPLFVLTNTNPEHENIWTERHRELLSLFKEVFVSSRLGCRKPDSDTFRIVARAMGVPCSRILFFDDALENIKGARQAGMHAELADNAATIQQYTQPLMDRTGK